MVIGFLLTVVTGLLAVPVAVLCFEVTAAIAFSRRREGIPLHNIKRPRLAVLVPAHNESAGLLPTLNDLKAQLRTGERLIVVADNCQDDTADLAAAAGAEVLERHDLTRHGKGYALDWGIQHLRGDPPDVLVIIDADC